MCIHLGGASDDTTGPLRQMCTCAQDVMIRHREGEHILYWKFQILSLDDRSAVRDM